ncbi:BofC C-terminal domain-containing protein [Cytobacillus oceanisediminis]|uniref:BofC C-terminal domain-containing protein n=1 Tax=Cytobacillus oceanisediminis TaxID=665099 RepID=UPI0011AAA8F3|nr:BofC C-terminal domain-containing protein [Cytobacillus oceanisediminis]
MSIFNGRGDGWNIIEWLLEMEVGRVERMKGDELKKGIGMCSKQWYEEVLERFKRYRVKELD